METRTTINDTAAELQPRRCALRERARSLLTLALLAAGLVAGLGLGARAQQADHRPVLLIDIKGVISFVAASQLTKALQKARTDNAQALIIRLDTPGGLLSSTRDMIQEMLGSPIPIIVYVAPNGARAASAGTYLVYASHLAAMAPGTHLGAATPVQLGAPGLPGSPPSKKEPGSDKPGEASDDGSALERKSVNDAAAYIRTLAQLRNRNAEWGEKAVREAATLTATDAQKERVIDIVAGNVGELMNALDGRAVSTATGEVRLATRGQPAVDISPDWKVKVMSAITDPNIAFILMMIGIYGILFEFMNPGAVAPGVVGGISLIVALTALSVLPVSYGGFALLLLGIGLMVAEAFAPSFGILGLGGIVAFIVGGLFLFDPDDPGIRLSVAWPVLIATAATSAIFFAFVVGLAVKARGRAVRTGSEAMIGSPGEVVSWSGSQGYVRAHGEIWSARSEANLTPGAKVRIAGLDGLTLIVVDAKPAY